VGVGNTIVVDVGIAGISQSVSVRVQLVWIEHERTIVRFVGDSVVVVVGVNTVSNSVAVGVRESLVDLPVTVVVDTVARLEGPRVHVFVERLAVIPVGNSIVVGIGIAGISHAVPVEILLIRIPEVGTVVLGVLHAVSIPVIAHTVSETVPVGVREILVNPAVTVVIQSVAYLRLRDRRITGLDSSHALELASAGAVGIGRFTVSQVDDVIHDTVAVVVHAIALLGSSEQGVTPRQSGGQTGLLAKTGSILILGIAHGGLGLLHRQRRTLTNPGLGVALPYRLAGDFEKLASVSFGTVDIQLAFATTEPPEGAKLQTAVPCVGHARHAVVVGSTGLA